MSSNLDDMYREVILDHYRSPRGKKAIAKIDLHSDGMNPACGDEISVEMELDGQTVKDVHVDCRGCAISVASGSMLAEIAKGKSIDELKRLAEAIRKTLKGESDEIPKEFEDLDALKGVKNFPVRVKCALLAWVTLVSGITNYEQGITNAPAISTEETD